MFSNLIHESVITNFLLDKKRKNTSVFTQLLLLLLIYFIFYLGTINKTAQLFF